jgi:very-short-patch-repair endonuclease
VDEDALGPERLIARNREVVDVAGVLLALDRDDSGYLYTEIMDKACTRCGRAVVRGPLCKGCAVRAAWLAKHPDWTPPLCVTCGAEITGRQRSRNVHCSIECKFADPEVRARVGRPRNRVIKTCPGCGADFAVAASMAGRYDYCTRECSVRARGRDGTCARCGGAFRHSQTQNRRYCCESCRRPPVLTECGHCGTEFRVVPSRDGLARYCSRHCYHASNAETSIERRVREALEHLGIGHRAQAQIGPWSVDFLVGTLLVIEADGAYWHDRRPAADARKTADLADRGYTVWRLHDDVINAAGFLDELERRLADYEVAFGQLARVAPGEAVAGLDQHRVIEGEPERPAVREHDAEQALIDI